MRKLSACSPARTKILPVKKGMPPNQISIYAGRMKSTRRGTRRTGATGAPSMRPHSRSCWESESLPPPGPPSQRPMPPEAPGTRRVEQRALLAGFYLGRSRASATRLDGSRKLVPPSRKLGRGDWGSLQSPRHNARLLMQCLAPDEGGGRIEQLFRFPSVVVFTGHMIDRDDRPGARFPPRLERW